MESIINQLLLDNDFIVICDEEVKQKLVSFFSSSFKKITYKSYIEFAKDIINIYDNALIEIVHNSNNSLNPEIVQTKLSNCAFIDHDNSNPKLNELYKMNQAYVNVDQTMVNYYSKHKVYLIDYYYDNDFVNKALSKINGNIINLISHKKRNEVINVDEFVSNIDEIYYIANEIAKLIHQGVDPKNIILNKPSNEYLPIMKQAFKRYNLDCDFKESYPLYSYEFTKKLVKALFDKEGLFNDCFKELIEEYKESIKNLDLLDKIIKALNPLAYYDYVIDENTKKIVIHLLKTTRNYPGVYENVISIEDVFSNVYPSDTHLFLLNFNQDVIPHTFKNDGYLQDDEKEGYNLLSTIEKNKKAKEKVKNFLKTYHNIHISYAKSTLNNQLVASSLLDELKQEINVLIEKKTLTIKDINNKEHALNCYVKAFEHYNKYHEITDDYQEGYPLFSSIEFKKYDSSFKGINDDVLANFIKKTRLSYSTLDDYFSCSFKYYIKYILGIVDDNDKTNENINLFVGSLYHYVLERLVSNNITDNIDQHINDYVIEFINKQEKDLSSKMNFYLKKYTNNIARTYQEIRKFQTNSKFEVFALEKKFEVALKNGINFIGFIDKILKWNDYYIVIDYKTKDVSVDWHKLNFGIEMQLPTYLYLIKIMDSNSKVGGCYLQSVLEKTPFKYNGKKSYDEQYAESRKYQGYSNNDYEVIKNIDFNHDNNDRSLPTNPFKNDGSLTANFIKKSFSDEEFSKIIKFTEKKINEASDNIMKGSFNINPIKIDKTFNSCNFCHYKRLCYKGKNVQKQYYQNKDFDFILRVEE